MVLSGIISLIERKVMATTQNRLGPSYFLFGLCTPIFDGVKLILKFNLLIMQIEVLFLVFILCASIALNYSIITVLPLSNILLCDIDFSVYLLLSLHLSLIIINSILVGCFILNSCFVYLGTLRHVLSSITSELGLLYIFFLYYVLNVEVFLNIQLTAENQLQLLTIQSTLITLPILFLTLLLLNSNVAMFEYTEAESELVAGTITEYSGIFFCIASLIEIFHVITSSLLLINYNIGNLYLTLNIIIAIVLLFILPKILSCKIKINQLLAFMLSFIYIILILYFFILMLLYILLNFL